MMWAKRNQNSSCRQEHKALLFSGFSLKWLWTKADEIILYHPPLYHLQEKPDQRYRDCCVSVTVLLQEMFQELLRSLNSFLQWKSIFTKQNLVDTYLLPASSNTFAVLRPFPSSSLITSCMISAPMKAYSSGRELSVNKIVSCPGSDFCFLSENA